MRPFLSSSLRLLLYFMIPGIVNVWPIMENLKIKYKYKYNIKLEYLIIGK